MFDHQPEAMSAAALRQIADQRILKAGSELADVERVDKLQRESLVDATAGELSYFKTGHWHLEREPTGTWISGPCGDLGMEHTLPSGKRGNRIAVPTGEQRNGSVMLCDALIGAVQLEPTAHES